MGVLGQEQAAQPPPLVKARVNRASRVNRVLVLLLLVSRLRLRDRGSNNRSRQHRRRFSKQASSSNSSNSLLKPLSRSPDQRSRHSPQHSSRGSRQHRAVLPRTRASRPRI